MDKFHKKVLQKNHTHIVNDIDLGQSSVLDKLREDGMISSNEEDIILSEKSKRNQNTKLLNFLKKRDPDSSPYDSFKRALGGDYTFIVDKLNKSEVELGGLPVVNDTCSTCVHCTLTKNLMPPDVTHVLYENGVLTDDDLDELNNDNLPRHDRVKRLLNLLKERPDQKKTVTQFSKSLEHKYKYLVQNEDNQGLERYLKCACNDHNDNVKVHRCATNDTKIVSSGGIPSQHAHINETSTYSTRSVCQSSWTSNGNESISVCDNCLSNRACGNSKKDYDHKYSRTSTGSSKRTVCEKSWVDDTINANVSNVETKFGFKHCGDKSNKITELTTDTDINPYRHEIVNTQAEKLLAYITQNTGFVPSQNELTSIEDNTRVRGENPEITSENNTNAVCENSWSEPDEIDFQFDRDSSLKVTQRSLVRRHSKEQTSVHNDRSVFDANDTHGRQNISFPDIVSVNTYIQLPTEFRTNAVHSDLGSRPFILIDSRPPLKRLSSSDSTCGIPISHALFVSNTHEIIEQCPREKAKKKIRRKRSRHSSLHHHQYDDVDGDTKHLPEATDEHKPDTENSLGVKKQEEDEDEDTLQSTVSQLVQPVFKALPNNKKLMRKCSRLWDQLFFLREKGDWDTFSLVTQKAFETFSASPDIQVLLYRSEMCVSTFYKNDQEKALEMFDKAIEQLPKTEMPNWHLARILPLKVELCTRSKMFEEASDLLEDAKQAMLSLGPCLSTGAVYFFEAIYLGNILQCTRNDTKSAEGITEQVKRCFLTAIEHYQQEETFAIKSFLNQVYLFLALFSLGVDFKKIIYIQVQDIKREDISLAEHYLNLFENNCWESSTNWSRMLFYIGRGEQHKQNHNLERSLDYFKQAKECSDSGKFGEHIGFIQNNIDGVTEKVEEQMRLKALRASASADDIMKKVLETSSESGSSVDN